VKIKFWQIILCVLFIAFIAIEVEGKGGDVAVRGHVRRDGTYVSPHKRSAPDAVFSNNWSTKGNYNPYTGKPGYKTQPNNSQPGNRFYTPSPVVGFNYEPHKSEGQQLVEFFKNNPTLSPPQQSFDEAMQTAWQSVRNLFGKRHRRQTKQKAETTGSVETTVLSASSLEVSSRSGRTNPLYNDTSKSKYNILPIGPDSPWKHLRKGMLPDAVRRLVGKPRSIEGKMVSVWNYENTGYVVFCDNKLERWQEPK